MNEMKPIVAIIDDDEQILKYLAELIRSVGLDVKTFISANEYLESDIFGAPGCMILDVRMPGLNGLDFQARLVEAGIIIPIIFITGHGNISMSVRALKRGAVDFLEKPIEDQVLLDAVHRAVDIDRHARREKNELDVIRNHYDSLTVREREVFNLVVDGLLNKQIAYELEISEKTVKVHRARVMHKMGATSLADLVKMSEKLPECASKI